MCSSLRRTERTLRSSNNHKELFVIDILQCVYFEIIIRTSHEIFIGGKVSNSNWRRIGWNTCAHATVRRYRANSIPKYLFRAGQVFAVDRSCSLCCAAPGHISITDSHHEWEKKNSILFSAFTRHSCPFFSLFGARAKHFYVTATSNCFRTLCEGNWACVCACVCSFCLVICGNLSRHTKDRTTSFGQTYFSSMAWLVQAHSNYRIFSNTHTHSEFHSVTYAFALHGAAMSIRFTLKSNTVCSNSYTFMCFLFSPIFRARRLPVPVAIAARWPSRYGHCFVDVAAVPAHRIVIWNATVTMSHLSIHRKTIRCCSATRTQRTRCCDSSGSWTHVILLMIFP